VELARPVLVYVVAEVVAICGMLEVAVPL